MFKPRVWVSVFVITLIYWGTWYSLQDADKTVEINPILKHLLNFTLLFTVGVVGYFGWKKHYQEWIKNLWVFIYSAVLIILVSFGLFDLAFKIGNENLRELLANFRLFFTSPVPFGICVYLGKRAEISAKK